MKIISASSTNKPVRNAHSCASGRKGFRPSGPQATISKQVLASGQWLAGDDPQGRRIAQLRKPVLVGGGALDELLPVANQRRLADVIPNAQRRIYPDASHGFFLQKRADFTARLKRFLGK